MLFSFLISSFLLWYEPFTKKKKKNGNNVTEWPIKFIIQCNVSPTRPHYTAYGFQEVCQVLGTVPLCKSFYNQQKKTSWASKSSNPRWPLCVPILNLCYISAWRFAHTPGLMTFVFSSYPLDLLLVLHDNITASSNWQTMRVQNEREDLHLPDLCVYKEILVKISFISF